MKKHAILASAVAMILTSGSALADGPTLYGKARLYLKMSENAAGVEEKSLESYSSRLGIKGSRDLDNGLSALYHFEFSIDADHGGGAANGDDDLFGARLGTAGLKGDFGQVLIGRQYTATYQLTTGVHDPFNSGTGGDLYDDGVANRVGDAISYVNKFGPVTFGAAIIAANGSDTLTDVTDIAVSVPVGPVTLSVASTNYDGGSSPTAFNIGWNGDGMSVNVGLIQTDDGSAEEDRTMITGKFDLASGTVLVQFQDDGLNDGFAAEYSHNLGKGVSAFIGIAAGDIEDDTTNLGLHVNF
jgi:predicted porin